MFRVVLQKTDVGIVYLLVGDYTSEQQARIKALSRCGKNRVTHIYDDQGNHIEEHGDF